MFLYLSRSPLGLRGLKSFCGHLMANLQSAGRSPLGLRGLKSFQPFPHTIPVNCRSPLGLRGLKYCNPAYYNIFINVSRSPLGLRGLKSQALAIVSKSLMSQPTRAAWIEI